MIGDLKKHLQSIVLRSLGRFRQEAIGVIALMAISIFFYRFVYLGNKADLAKVVTTHFPHLKVYLTQDRKWKEKYWQNMFDAVALAMTHRILGGSRN